MFTFAKYAIPVITFNTKNNNYILLNFYQNIKFYVEIIQGIILSIPISKYYKSKKL